MSNEFTDSCSHYGLDSQLLKKWSGPPQSNTVHVGTSYALGVAPQGIRTDSSALSVPLPALTRRVFGARFRVVSTSSGSLSDFIKFIDGTTVQDAIGWTAGQNIIIRRGTSTIATSASTISLVGSIHTIAVDCLIDPAAGVINVYIDGSLFVTFSGNTRATSNTQITNIKIGDENQFKSIDWSDIYINNTLGTVNNGVESPHPTILPMRMNAAGVFTMFGRGGVDLGSNVAQINEILAASGSFNRDNVVGDRDNFVPTAMSSITPKGARLWAYAQKNSAAGNRYIALTVGSGAVDDIGGDQALVQGYSFYTRDLGVDPNTAALVTLANLNAYKPGYKITL